MEIRIDSEYDIVTARTIAKAEAKRLGFNIVDQTRIATAISELARNAVTYAGGGIIKINEIEKEGRKGIEIWVIDEGPGIEDIELALTDGWSSGEGLGIGLSGARRLMDEFEIYSEIGKGTKVRVVKWKRT
ncbi:MAG: anti-sigma regulatory factor [Candidatus Methanospirareceae archaeon]